MNFLNNIKVRYKLIFIYIFCIVVPIIIINIIFYQNMAANVEEIHKNYYHLSTQRITGQIKNDLDFIISLSTKVSFDRSFYEKLDNYYQTNLEYVELYYDYFQSYLDLYGETYSLIDEVRVYTNNPTILNSGSIRRITENTLEQQWYKRLRSTPEKLHIVYGESKINTENTIVTPISIVKYLNEYDGIDTYLKIIKIDLNPNHIVDIIKSESVRGNVFIQNADKKLIFADNISFEDKELYQYINNNENRIIQRGINRYFNWDIINFINMEELRDALQEPKNKIILLTLGSVFLSTLILILIYRSLYVRLTNLSDHVEKLDQENFSKQFTGSQGEDEIGKLIKAFNRMVVKIKMLITDVYDAKLERSNIKLEKKQAELNALQSQLKPHFLFNTLESIRMKSLEKKENETADIIKYLARSFRRMISHEQEWVKVSDEVTYIKDFLKIQKYRFGSEFEFSLEIDPEALNIQIPKLTIQPLVENGCVHGIERSEEKGQINVSIRIVDNKLICNIEDNGIGISRERLDYMFSRVKDDKEAGDNIGLINIYKRLDLYYGDEFDLKIKSKEGKGTSVTLIMPLGSEYF